VDKPETGGETKKSVDITRTAAKEPEKKKVEEKGPVRKPSPEKDIGDVWS
jgi:hypothetical protein